MNNKSNILLIALLSIFLFINCNKEKDLNLYPTASLNVNFKLKEYGKKVSNSKEETLPIAFKTTITIKGDGIPEHTTYSEAHFNGNFYVMVTPIEAPLDKPFTLTISTKGDSTTWEGSQNNIILEESRLPLQTSLTLSISSIMDIDGNIYKTVQIGSQLWLASNLKVTHYRNGEEITYAPDAAQWISLGGFNGAYCNLYNDVSNVANYGRLYKHYTTMDFRGVCPSGWRIPTMTDWDLLASTLGGTSVAGGMMKVAGTDYWASPNVGADNSSGFSAYPSLGRGNAAAFDSQIGSFAIWWSSPMWDTNNGRVYAITNDNASLINGPQPLEDGVAIRCIK